MKVLFICTGNAYRSPLAEALLKKERPDLEADSAGTQKASRIAEETRLIAKSYDAEQFLKKTPEDLESKNLQEYDLIVAMEPVHRDAVLIKCPECDRKVIVWNIQDVISQQQGYIKKSSRQVAEKVKQLARTL